jgi:hypothetical protein
MAFKHYNTQTLTTASIIHQVDANARPQTPLTIYNGHSGTIFVGDSVITTSGVTVGRPLVTTASQTFYVSAGDIIYGISAAASAAGAVVITYSA